jgi:hypothetical protein
LSPVEGFATVLAGIDDLLPLRPVSERAHLVATYVESDILDLLSMRDSVQRLPAQLVLESGGLDAETAREFFDDLVAPLWTGSVTFAAVRENRPVFVRTVYMLQGEAGWLIYKRSDEAKVTLENPTEGGKRRIVSENLSAVQTAQ